MFKVAIAHSIELDSQDAIKEVLEQCHEQLGDLKPQAGILFTGIDHNHSLILNRINKMYPNIELIGCTTGGEISSVNGFAEDSIVLTLFCSDELYFKAGVADRVSEDPVAKIKKAVEATKSRMDQEPDLCIVTPNVLVAGSEGPIGVNIDEVVVGLKQSLGETFPIFGGCATNPTWQDGHQFYNNKVFTDAAPFLFISGPLLFSLGVESGWMPIGKKIKVTHAENTVIFKIGDQSALEFYKHYLGEFDFEGVIEYPLAIFEKDEDNFRLRAPGLFDTEKGSLSFTGVIREGTTVQLTHTTRDKVIKAVEESVKSAVAEYPGSNPAIALCFTCIARKIVLGSRVEEEYQVLKKQFPDLPVAGFYTGGEITPLGRDKPSRLHNETFVSLLLGVE